MDELEQARDNSVQRLIWGLILLLGILALVVVVIASAPKAEDVICRRWDRTDAVIAQRRGDRITYTDMNGLPRTIEGAESSDWDCDK